jgi:fructoselysine-6-P-deglycase FrlB-like protein
VTTTTAATTPVQPLAAVPADYADRIGAAVDRYPEVDAVVRAAVAGGLARVLLVGCGGSLFSFGPLRTILDPLPIPVSAHNADELLLRRPAGLGPGALVVVSCTRGETRETARLAAAARAAGATVVGITQDPQSIVAVECDTVLLHDGVEAKQVVLAQLGWSLLRATGVGHDHDRALAALARAPRAFLDAVRESDERLGRIARALHTEPVVYVLGSGPLESAARTIAVCYLQEMQWKHAVAVGSGEFLHGSFEVVTEDLPVLVLHGEDATRPMGDRVRAFLDGRTGRAHHLDARDLTLAGVEPRMRPFLGSLVMASAIPARLAQHLESWTGHALTDRRYMWKVEY